MRKDTVLVTGAGSFCAINIIKSLKAVNQYRIITTDIYPASVGVFRSDAGYLVPQEGEDDRFIKELLKICSKEKVAILIPGFDSELPFILQAKQKFEVQGTRVLIGNERLIDIGNDKLKLAGFLKDSGFPFLKSYPLSEHRAALKELSYPFVVKPKAGWGQRGFHLISSRRDFDYVLGNLKASQDYMIQEYIDEREGEYSNSVSVALDGDILGCICSRRELVKGDSRKIIIDHYPELREQMIRLARQIGSPGPMNVQCRLKKGKAYIFEINARFSTTNVVRAACGYNEVVLLTEHFLTGKKKYIRQYKKKVALVYLDYVYVDPKAIDGFKEKARTTAKAAVKHWL